MSIMEKQIRETIRYLGYGKHEVDDATFQMILDCMEELTRIINPRIISKSFPLTFMGCDELSIGEMVVQSKNLSKNLAGCEKIILLAATIGVEADRIMKRYSLTDMARVVVLQACGAALLEQFIDECQFEIQRKVANEGYYLRPRFSPGYGDFSIEHQKQILQMLNAAKEIGVSSTESSMLTPTKSVTALIGLSKSNQKCHPSGCEACQKYDCIYRRC